MYQESIATKSGYWKITWKDSQSCGIGMKKTLNGRNAPTYQTGELRKRERESKARRTTARDRRRRAVADLNQ